MHFARCTIGILAFICTGGLAYADGPTAAQLAHLLASGPTVSDTGQERMRATAAEAAISTIANGAVQANAGDTSGTVLLAATPGATNKYSLAARAGEHASVRDYAPNELNTGGCITLNILEPQSTADHVVVVQSVAGLDVGKLVTAPNLPPGTRISGVGSATQTTVTQNTNATTLTDSELQQLVPTPGKANALSFASVLAVPPGTSANGPNLPIGTKVASVSYAAGGGTVVYLNNNVTSDIQSGTAITFTYTSTSLGLTNGWVSSVAPGAAIGVVTQDDWPAFQSSAYNLAPEHGGPGGTIWVPSGIYYLSQSVTTYDGISFEFGDGARFAPGSSGVDVIPLGITDNANMTIAGSGRNPLATSLVVAQNLFQQPAKTLQGQGLLVTENNVNCTNDGGGNGCGMVGAEVKQGIAASITRGIMWAYHSTDDLQTNQSVAYAGAELELRNNSGIDWMWGSTLGNKTGLHIDDLGNTPNTVALLAGGNAPTGGGWHRSMDCNRITIMDYCFDVQDSPLSGTGLEPVIVAGLDMTGRYLGTGLTIYSQLSASTRALSNTGAAIDGAGNIGGLSLSTQTISGQTAAIGSVTIQDGGATDTPYSFIVQPPPNGTAAVIAASGYSLRILQGGGPTNQPVEMQAGDRYTIPGGSCSISPQVTYTGSSWIISNPGACSVPPIGTQASPVTATGGSATVAPQFWPMWQLTSLSIQSGGSGYNPAVPPYIEILTNGSGVRQPKAVPVMTTAPATLSLNSGSRPGVVVSTTGAVSIPNGLTVSDGISVDTIAASGSIQAAAIRSAGSSILVPSDSSYQIQQTDCGVTLEPQPNTGMTITVPAGLPAGCKIDIIQNNTEIISFAAGAGLAMHSLNGASRIVAIYGKASMLVDSASSFILSGDIH